MLALVQRVVMVTEFDLDAGWRTAYGLLFGTALDLWPVLAGLTLIVLFPSIRLLRLATWLLFLVSGIAIICDTLYFLVTRLRIDSVLLVNINPYSLRGMFSLETAAGALGLVTVCALLGRIGWPLVATLNRPGTPRASWFPTWVTLGLSAVLLAGAFLYRPISVDRRSVDPRRLSRTELVDNIRSNIEGSVVLAQNQDLAILRRSSLGNFIGSVRDWLAPRTFDTVYDFAEYQPTERRLLRDLGLHRAPQKNPRKDRFDRIILVIAESLPLEYLPAYNPKIPRHVTPYLERLIARQLSLENYWTTNLPTDQGLYAMFLSRPAFDPGLREKYQLETLFTLLEESGFSTHFVRGPSERYANHRTYYPRWFGMQEFYGAETLRAKEPGLRGGSWGVGDCEVLDDVIKTLDQNRNHQTFVVAKTIDTHYPFSGHLDPRSLSQLYQKNPLLVSLRSFDTCLSKFADDLGDYGLFDDRTLLIITSDHTPNHGPYRRWTPQRDYRPERLPLILATKAGARGLGIRPDLIASQLDFAPTILALAGLPSPPYAWGRDLSSKKTGDLAVSFETEHLIVRTKGNTFTLPYEKPLSREYSDPLEAALAKWVNNMRSDEILEARH